MTSRPLHHTAHFPKDELDQLELRIAQRADQLAAGTSTDPETDRQCWDQAEAEELELALCSGRLI
jgi:hypothetical protein